MHAVGVKQEIQITLLIGHVLALYSNMFIYLLLWCHSIDVSWSNSFNASGQGLTSIPSILIPIDVKTIQLDYNFIETTEAEDFQNFYQLRTFILRYGVLSVFPNFTFVSQTLELVRLSNNNISIIPPELLNILASLNTLDLTHNKLKSIPDVNGPGKSLQKLYISHNSFTEFPSLKFLGKILNRLRFQDNDITRFKATYLPIQIHHINKTVVINLNSNKNLVSIPPILSKYRNQIRVKLFKTGIECGAQLLWLLSADVIFEGECTDVNTGEMLVLQEQLLLNYSGDISIFFYLSLYDMFDPGTGF